MAIIKRKNSGDFKKGYDPRRSTKSQFKKGEPSANPRLSEVGFFSDSGRDAAAAQDLPRVTTKSTDLIAPEFHIVVDSGATAIDLIPYLDMAINFGEKMLAIIASSPDQEHGAGVGKYVIRLDQCLRIRSQILSGGTKASNFGWLSDEDLDAYKVELSVLMSAALTKLNHSTNWADRRGVLYADGHKKEGQIFNWVFTAYPALIAAIARTIESRAQLDAWEKVHDKNLSAIEAAYKETV